MNYQIIFIGIIEQLRKNVANIRLCTCILLKNKVKLKVQKEIEV